jgi:hypothetical protein
MTKTQKVAETKKTLEENTTEKTSEKNTTEKNSEKTTAEKIPKKSKSDAPVKKNLTILKRPSQPKVSPINPPSTSKQKNLADKPEMMSQGRALTPFSLEGDLAKIKIPIPLIELMNRGSYRSQVIKALAIEPDIGTKALTIGSTSHLDTVNLTDDRPELLFRPEVDG